MSQVTLLLGLVVLVLSFIFAIGGGGALIYVPLFTWFGLPLKTVAIPTGLLLNGVTALSASLFYLRAGMADWRGALPMIVTMAIGAPIGAIFTHHLPESTLRIIFVSVMVFAAIRMLLNRSKPDPTELLPYARRAVLTGGAGLGIGVVAGMIGIGGGSLVVPVLMAIGYPAKVAAATSFIVVTLSSFSGFASHLAQSQMNWPVVAISVAAVVIGSQVGARVMKQDMKAQWIETIFAVLLLGVAALFAWPAIASWIN